MAAWGKKKTLGFEKKPRTRQELEEDYGNHAFQVGHKSRILKTKFETYEAAEKQLNSDIDQHHKIMGEILEEMSKHPEKGPETGVNSVVEHKGQSL